MESGWNWAGLGFQLWLPSSLAVVTNLNAEAVPQANYIGVSGVGVGMQALIFVKLPNMLGGPTGGHFCREPGSPALTFQAGFH